MRYSVVIFGFLVACGSTQREYESFDVIEQNFDSTPRRPLVCDYPMWDCGGKTCVNLRFDNKNCGVCGNECDLPTGEFCYNYQCRSIDNSGFNHEILNVGPINYDVKRDLPRPNPVQTKP